MKEGWMKNVKDEWRMMKDEGWMMKEDDLKLLRGFADWRTDIHDYRVAGVFCSLKPCSYLWLNLVIENQTHLILHW